MTLRPHLSPFDEHYGLELESVSADEVRAYVAVEERICNPFGQVHGGLYAAIAEAVATAGTLQGVRPDGRTAVGLANNTSLLRPIDWGRVHATARPRHRGRTTWVWEVEMCDEAGRLCALTRMTVAVRKSKGDTNGDNHAS